MKNMIIDKVLDYIEVNKIPKARFEKEVDLRRKVAVLAKLAGFGSRRISIHSARHSFAMLFMNKGFSIEEVAELLGDTTAIAKRYARITNTTLHNRILKVMGDNEPPINHESSK